MKLEITMTFTVELSDGDVTAMAFGTTDPDAIAAAVADELQAHEGHLDTYLTLGTNPTFTVKANR